jgi:transposase
VAYREIAMWEILEVLRRLGSGEKQRAVARVTGHGRMTVRRYEETARELGWVPGQREPDEDLARAVAASLRPGGVKPPGATEAGLVAHRERLREWLRPEDGSRGLQLTKVHELLARQGIRVPYSSLHRFAVKHCDFGRAHRVTVRRAEVAPGEVAEVDFGRLGLVYDAASGKPRVHHALIVTLVHSRHQYVHICPSQRLEDLIGGLEAAWIFFGGVPARVVIDNLKAAVTKSDRYDPIFQRVFSEYADYRGFVIDAAVARHPTGKPVVERSVQYVRESFFRGEQWIDRDHVQREANRWCLSVAGQRIHGTTRERPIEVFEQIERPALRPLTKPAFDPPSWAECKVHPDHHVQFQKSFYSAPTRYVGGIVTVRGDSKLIRFYVKGELVKTHARVAPGRRSTDYADYPRELAPYAMRDPDRMIAEARGHGPHLGAFMEKLLAGDFPWARLRQAQKLLRLVAKYGSERLDAACRRAIHFDLYNVKRVEGIVQGDLEREALGSPRQGQLIEIPAARFLRPRSHFHHPNKENDHGDPELSSDGSEEAATVRPADHACGPGCVCEEDKAR